MGIIGSRYWPALLFLSLILLPAVSYAQEFSEPIVIEKFRQFKTTQITPEDWLKELLSRQRDGLTGNIEVAGYPYNTSMWAATKFE